LTTRRRHRSFMAKVALYANVSCDILHIGDIPAPSGQEGCHALPILCRTKYWSRRPTAYARSSLPLSGAAHRGRSASNGRLSWSEQAYNILSQYQS
jgi:hypothetical protein